MNNIKNEIKIFNPEMIDEMKNIFSKMGKKLILKLYLDKREVSEELESYVKAMTELTDKLTFQIEDKNGLSDTAPYVEICSEDNTPTGLAFHGVPLGHEFSSFLVGIYNASVAGQVLDEITKKRILAINTPLDIKVLVTLSCPMCPELVVAAQHIAALNSGVKAHIYDVKHFEKLRNKYNVMSVPCLVINEEKVSFGKKSINELLDFIEE